MTELSKILEIAGHNRQLKDSRRALEEAGAIIHVTDAELANDTFSPLEPHGVIQTGDQVLPTANSNILSIANETEVVSQKPISPEETSGWNRITHMFRAQKKEKKLNAA